MAAVVGSLSVASIGASLWSITLSLREGIVLVSQVCVLAVIEGCVDGSSQLGWASVAINWVRRAGLVITC